MKRYRWFGCLNDASWPAFSNQKISENNTYLKDFMKYATKQGENIWTDSGVFVYREDVAPSWVINSAKDVKL